MDGFGDPPSFPSASGRFSRAGLSSYQDVRRQSTCMSMSFVFGIFRRRSLPIASSARIAPFASRRARRGACPASRFRRGRGSPRVTSSWSLRRAGWMRTFKPSPRPSAPSGRRSNGRGWLAEARGWRPTAHDPVRSGSRRCGRAVLLHTKSTLTPSRRWPPSKPGFAGAKRSWPKRQRVSCSRCVRERGGRFGSGGQATRGHCSARTTGAVVFGPGGVERIPAARRGLLRGTGRAGRHVGGRSTRFFLLGGNYHGFSPQGLAAPKLALLSRDGQLGVWIVRAGRISFRAVELGIDGEAYVEVLAGLRVGDRVVTGPADVARWLAPAIAVREKER